MDALERREEQGMVYQTGGSNDGSRSPSPVNDGSLTPTSSQGAGSVGFAPGGHPPVVSQEHVEAAYRAGFAPLRIALRGEAPNRSMTGEDHGGGISPASLSRQTTVGTSPVYGQDTSAPENVRNRQRVRHQVHLEQNPRAVQFRDQRNRLAAEMAKAQPLSALIGKVMPKADQAVWLNIEQQNPDGAKCLSRVIERAIASPTFKNASPADRQRYTKNLASTLGEMQSRWSREDERGRNFAERVLDVASRALGNDDAVIFNNLPMMILGGQRFNLNLREVFNKDADIPNDPGICFRASVKWAGCQVVDAPFKYRDLNAEKTVAKQQGYRDAFRSAKKDTARELMREDPTGALFLSQAGDQRLIQAGLDAEVVQVSTWLNKFTDAQGVKHASAVSVGDLNETPDLAAFLTANPMQPNEAILISLDKMAGDECRGAHTIAIRGGDKPTVFNSPLGEYEYAGSNFGRDIVAFLEAVHKTPGIDRLRFHVLRVRRATSSAESQTLQQ